MSNQEYKIDKETLKWCNELEYYDKFHCFSWEKKKILITLENSSIEKLKKVKNKSKFINHLIEKSKFN